jgi:hypothetical protein
VPGTRFLAGFAISIRVSLVANPFDTGRVRERAIVRDLVKGSRILLALLRDVTFAVIGPYTSARGELVDFVFGHKPGCASVDLVAVGRCVHAVNLIAVRVGTVVTKMPRCPNIESGDKGSTWQASQRALAIVPRSKSVAGASLTTGSSSSLHPTLVRPSEHTATHPQPNALPIRLLIAGQASLPSLTNTSDLRPKTRSDRAGAEIRVANRESDRVTCGLGYELADFIAANPALSRKCALLVSAGAGLKVSCATYLF